MQFNLEAAQVSISRWVDKITVGHLHNGILFSRKTLCNSMDGPGEHYAKWNKPIREKQILYDFTHVESNEQTELISEIETDAWTESRMAAMEGWGGRGIKQKGKRTHGHGQQRGDYGGRRGV